MGRFRCIKWQDHDGVWHYQMVGDPGRTRRARRKWQRDKPAKPTVENESLVKDPEFVSRLGYLSYLLDHGIIGR